MREKVTHSCAMWWRCGRKSRGKELGCASFATESNRVKSCLYSSAGAELKFAVFQRQRQRQRQHQRQIFIAIVGRLATKRY